MIWLSLLGLIASAGTLVAFLSNLPKFERAVSVPDERTPVSVLIPARNEESGIAEMLRQVLDSADVMLEVIVLDDNSTDRTREIVSDIAANDPRLRLIAGGELPAGWCGKQFACQQLADAANHEDLVFLDADVHIEPTAICRSVATRHALNVDLLSGFPTQLTKSIGERLLIPLIQYILLCYLPFGRMRSTTEPAASAGCGQFFITTRTAHQRAGGHAAIRASLHDGLMMPRAYRSAGLTTDVVDASDIASVRMYRGFREAWNGLSKNAIEGVANARLIGPVTLLLAAAHLLPWGTLIWAIGEQAPFVIGVSLPAIAASLIPRWLCATRFDRAWSGVLLHPVSILLFLTIQWTSLIRSLRHETVVWRGRTYGDSKPVCSDADAAVSSM